MRVLLLVIAGILAIFGVWLDREFNSPAPPMALLKPVLQKSQLLNCYDRDACYSNKSSVIGTGYKVHVTETYDGEEVYRITYVEIAQAHNNDMDQTDKQGLLLLEKYGCVSPLGIKGTLTNNISATSSGG